MKKVILLGTRDVWRCDVLLPLYFLCNKLNKLSSRAKKLTRFLLRHGVYSKIYGLCNIWTFRGSKVNHAIGLGRTTSQKSEAVFIW